MAQALDDGAVPSQYMAGSDLVLFNRNLLLFLRYAGF